MPLGRVLMFRQENHTIDVARLNNITLEYHDPRFFEEVIWGAAMFKVKANTLYTYDPLHLHEPCHCIPTHTIKMARAVPAGLRSIADLVGELGRGENKESIYARGAWGAQ